MTKEQHKLTYRKGHIMPAMTSAGARLILEGYRTAISDTEKFHIAILDILEHFILIEENHETIKIFETELVLFINEIKTEASEHQLSGPIRNWEKADQPLPHNSEDRTDPDPLSGPICNWSHTAECTNTNRRLAWLGDGEN